MNQANKTARYTISIDPGFRHCGVSCFEGTTLKHATLVETQSDSDIDPADQFSKMGSAVADYVESLEIGNSFHVAIEYPQQYQRTPTPRESVQRVVGVIGAILAALQARTGGLSVRVTSYTPQAWKGQVPKDIMVERIRGRLLDAELSTLPEYPKSKMHNVIDAIGIGLKHLNRLKLKRA